MSRSFFVCAWFIVARLMVIFCLGYIHGVVCRPRDRDLHVSVESSSLLLNDSNKLILFKP